MENAPAATRKTELFALAAGLRNDSSGDDMAKVHLLADVVGDLAEGGS